MILALQTPYMDKLVPQGTQISLIFALWRAVFQLQSISVLVDLARVFEMVKADMLTGIYYSPEGPILYPFRSIVSYSQFQLQKTFV